MKSFSVERITYQQKLIRCGKAGCKACPHGPYWYAFWDQAGRTKSKYIGKELPPGLEPVEAPPPPPPKPKPLTLRQARRVLGLTGNEPYDRAYLRYQARRSMWATPGTGRGCPEVQMYDEAWAVVLPTLAR